MNLFGINSIQLQYFYQVRKTPIYLSYEMGLITGYLLKIPLCKYN
jgi:hypothetical protein